MPPTRPLAIAIALCCAFAAPSARSTDLAGKADVAGQARALMAQAWPADGPGAVVLVARGDEVLFAGARGLADLEAGTPLEVGDTFRIGSVTKQFSAAGLLKLVQDGKVGLEDPLAKYLPDFPNGANITVRQLLNHTSGVRSYTGIPDYMAERIRADLDTSQLVGVFKDLPVDFAPGDAYAYNNSGYVLVGAVIEAASGQAWHAYLEDALFEPLGLDDTGYGADPGVAAAHVRGYTMDDDKETVPARPLSMTQPHAAGALVSSVDDLLAWNRALHEGRVIEAGLYEAMVTPAGAAGPAGYGYGIGRGTLRGETMFQHGGGIHGFSSYLLYLPDSDTTVAVLRNSDATVGNLTPTAVAHRLAAVALGKPFPSMTPIEVDAATLAEAEGVYRINDQHERILRVVDGTLTGQRTGGNPAGLTPIATDTYLYEDGFNYFELVRDATGTVTGMRFFPNGEGEGEVAALTDKPLPPPRVEVPVTPAMAARVSGSYAMDAMTLKVYQDGDRMIALMSGEQPVEIFAESPDRFFLKVVPAALEFAPGDVAPKVTLLQGGEAMEFVRTR